MVEIKLENLTKRFGEVTAVDGVTLTVHAGELFFLLGPSGCGKTTLLRLVAGFITPDVGTIHFDNTRVDHVAANLRNTGMVFQNYALWPHLNVGRNVQYGLDIRRLPKDVKRQRVDEMLALVQMAGYADRMPSALSGGQQQRVAVARALAPRPAVVLLDEPLSNLDAKLRLEMRSEIRRIHDRIPRTAIYVTHDQTEALSMADRIAVMKDGRIVQVGTPEEIHTHPVNLFCAEFIGNCNVIAGAVRETGGRHAVVETALGKLAGSAARSLAEGDDVALTVRPELLREAAEGEPNAFEAEVVTRMYLGEMIQYELRVGDQRISATVLGSADWDVSVGDTVRVAFDADRAPIFGTAEEGAR